MHNYKAGFCFRPQMFALIYHPGRTQVVALFPKRTGPRVAVLRPFQFKAVHWDGF